MLNEQLTPKELVYKHIFDKSHTVTEEELKNVKVGFLHLELEGLEETIANNLLSWRTLPTSK